MKTLLALLAFCLFLAVIPDCSAAEPVLAAPVPADSPPVEIQPSTAATALPVSNVFVSTPVTASAAPVSTSAVALPPLAPQEDICAALRGGTILDQARAAVNTALCEPAAWLDSFFGDNRLLDAPRPTLLVIARNSAQVTDGIGAEMLPDYRVTFRLPQLRRLLKVVSFSFSSRSSTPDTRLQPGQAEEPGTTPRTRERKATAGFQSELSRKPNSILTADGGLRAEFPFEPFFRARYQNTALTRGDFTLRFRESAMLRASELFTGGSALDFDYKLSKTRLLRWTNSATYTQKEHGIVWNTGVSLFCTPNPQTAVSYDLNMWGGNYPGWFVENHRAAVRYRRNFHRKWLFYELEPEITWPRIGKRAGHTITALRATLEVRFGR